MSKFIGPFIIEPDTDERTAIIHEPFEYYSDRLERRIIIPKGFVTDGASVPRIFWNIIPPWGKYGRAAVVHDYLYRWQWTSKKDADAVLLEAMWVCSTAWWQMGAIWTAVHFFGGHAWREDSAKPLPPEQRSINAGEVVASAQEKQECSGKR